MGRVLKLAFFVVFVAVTVGAAWSTYDVIHSSGNGTATATRAVQSAISAVVNADNAAQDYALQRNGVSSTTYQGALHHVDNAVADLRRRVSDDGIVQRQLRRFENAVDHWRAQVELAADRVPAATARVTAGATTAAGTATTPGPRGAPGLAGAPGAPAASGANGGPSARRDPMINDIRTSGDVLSGAIEDAAGHQRDQAALEGLMVVGGMFILFAGLVWLSFERAKRRAAKSRDQQRAFSEQLETARSEEQAQAMLAEHLESLVPNATVLVTDDRDGPVDGRPIVAHGERIGTAVVRSGRDLRPAVEHAVRDSILRAAPAIGSLRSLAAAQVHAATDPLTGLGNRRLVQEELTRIAAHAARTGDPFAVVMIDLDRFKPVNDSFGHAAGDALLVAIAQVLRGETRGYDVLGRRGGDEFIAVLPGVDASGAADVMERCRAGIAALRVGRPPVTATASFGVTVGGSDRSAAPDELVREADAAVYSAKARGGNCVVTNSASLRDPVHT